MSARRLGHSLSRRTLLHAAGAAAALALAGCTTGPPSVALRMACGERGGTYVQFGELLSAAYGRRRPDGLTVLETDGSVDNLSRLRSGGAELAIALADAVVDDATGAVAIGRVYQNYLQCFVLADGPVRSADDLHGRRVSLGAPSSGAAMTAARVFDALDLMTGAVPAATVNLRIEEAVTALAAGEIDALVWSGGLPLPAVAAVEDTMPVRLVDLTAALPALRERHPGLYVAASVPPDTYGDHVAVPSIGIPNLLLARDDFPDADAAALVDVLIDDARLLVPDGSLGVQFLSAANLIDTSPIGLHPAASRRYRERYG